LGASELLEERGLSGYGAFFVLGRFEEAAKFAQARKVPKWIRDSLDA